MRYFRDIGQATRTLWEGLGLTLGHFWSAVRQPRRDNRAASDAGYFAQAQGIMTLQYPHEQLAVPDNGRYQLHNEIDDCIVCDKCAKVCPVDCIDIEPIKATEQIGTASDGTPIRLYAAKFDIDMAKCCFCGLCTTVCPTECLTMTKVYDFSEYDLGKMNYHFATLSPEEAEQKRQAAEAAKAQKAKLVPEPESGTAITPTPVEAVSLVTAAGQEPVPPPEGEADVPKPKPRPVFKRAVPPAQPPGDS
jgi:formate hydrogenlyase subunit 6/NADH:ubiquinone oxidoreductase subunit I